MISGNASSTCVLSGSLSLSNYLNLPNYNGPVTFALSNGMSLPTGAILGSNGSLSLSLTNSVTSKANLVVTNRWGNSLYFPLAYNVIIPSAPTPSLVSQVLSITAWYSIQTYTMTWDVTVANATSMTILREDFLTLNDKPGQY